MPYACTKSPANRLLTSVSIERALSDKALQPTAQPRRGFASAALARQASHNECAPIMLYRIAADVTLILHLAFILFVCVGALLSQRWRWLPVVHLPCAAWGAYVEIAGRLCPLTCLENRFRRLAGDSGYHSGFVENYLLPVIYPSELTREVQYLFAAVVVLLNVAAYGWLIHKRTRGQGDA
jgi:hypothetical protein